MTAPAYVPEPFGCRYTDGCRGVRVNPYQGCWAHLDPEDRDRALSHLEPGGHVVPRTARQGPSGMLEQRARGVRMWVRGSWAPRGAVHLVSVAARRAKTLVWR